MALTDEESGKIKDFREGLIGEQPKATVPSPPPATTPTPQPELPTDACRGLLRWINASLSRGTMLSPMRIGNTRQAYGWAAIALHWVSAVGVTALYLLGERMEEAPDRAAKVGAQDLHVSVGVMLFGLLAARLLWSAAQPKPAPLEARRLFRIAAAAVQGLLLLMITMLLITGPLSVWSTGRPIEVFDLFSLSSPFGGRAPAIHEFAKEVHGAASKLFWPLIALHLGGALKHLVVDRDETLQRMLWAPARKA